MKRITLHLALVLSSAGFALAAPLPATTFGYDSSTPLNVMVLHQGKAGGITLRDITFDSPKGGKIHALLMLPRQPRHRSGVLFVHWLGEPKTTNLTEFHRDALAAAQRGSVALLIDAMWSQPDWYEKIRTPETDYTNSIKQVIDLRRSLDVLLHQTGIDQRRIAYVGHDFGAMYGAVLAGVDDRVRWYVLIAGTTSFNDWYLYAAQPKDKPAYLAQMSQLDPTLYLPKSKAEEFLFQFAKNDRYISMERAVQFTSAAPLPHGMFVYDTDHAVAVPEAFRDRISWLEARLTPAP